jgi:hypothetical protein
MAATRARDGAQATLDALVVGLANAAAAAAAPMRDKRRVHMRT